MWRLILTATRINAGSKIGLVGEGLGDFVNFLVSGVSNAWNLAVQTRLKPDKVIVGHSHHSVVPILTPETFKEVAYAYEARNHHRNRDDR